MSTEKKILFLFLAFIVLIVTCVFTHIDKIKAQESTAIETSSESSGILKGFMDTVKSVTSSNEVEDKQIDVKDVVEEEKKVEEKTEEIKVSENVEPSQNQSITTNETEDIKESKLEQAEEVIEEVEEKLEKPLITTDTRYKRVGSEKRIEELSKEAQLLQVKMTEYVKENPITFKRASNNIVKSSDKTIRKIVTALKEFPNMKIEVAGHTDAAGAAKLNQTISEKRAISVKQRLISYGIDKNRIKARGYGESIPLVKNSPNGYSKINRRVEFNIVEE